MSIVAVAAPPLGDVAPSGAYTVTQLAPKPPLQLSAPTAVRCVLLVVATVVGLDSLPGSLGLAGGENQS